MDGIDGTSSSDENDEKIAKHFDQQQVREEL